MSQTDALIHRFPLKKAKIIKKTLMWAPVLGPMILMFGGMVAMVSWLGLFLILFAGLAIHALIFVYETYYYRNYFYDLTEDGLVIGQRCRPGTGSGQ